MPPYILVHKFWYNPKTRQVEYSEFFVNKEINGHPTYELVDMAFGWRRPGDVRLNQYHVFNKASHAHLDAIAQITEQMERVQQDYQNLLSQKEAHITQSQKPERDSRLVGLERELELALLQG